MKQVVRQTKRLKAGSVRTVGRARTSELDVRRALSMAVSHIEPLERREYLSVTTDPNGWTVVTPSADSRVIYVSSSAGNDSNTGLSPTAPLQTVAKAETLMRTGFPDQVLLKRGDTFGHISFNNSGRSAQEPMLFSYYGDNSLPRPVVDSGPVSGFLCGGLIKYLDVIGIDFTSSTHDPTSPNFDNQASYGFYSLGTIDTLTIEDCRFRNFVEGVVLQATPTLYGPISNVTFRRNEVVDCFTTNGNSQGMYCESINGLTMDENIFDQDGWSTLVPGAGANTFSHDVYIHSSCTNCVFTNNIFADAASHGLQARGGGLVQGNLFLNDAAGLSFGLVNGATTHAGGVSGQVIGNVILGSGNGVNGGLGMELGNLAPGGNTLVSNNIIADAPTISVNPAFWLSPGSGVSNPQQEAGLNSLSISNNVVYQWGWGLYVSSTYVPGSTGADALSGVVISNNHFDSTLSSRIVNQAVAYDPRYEDLSGNVYYYNSSTQPGFEYASPSTSAGNPYYLPTGGWVAGIEPSASLTQTPYVDPKRNIDTYMASLGLTGGTAAYLALIDSFNEQNWNPILMPTAVNAYIQAGFSVDAAAPTAVLAPTPDVVNDTSPSQTFSITYNDNVAIDATTLGNGNVVVLGPGGVSLPATLISTGAVNGPSIVATYQISAPGGTWTNLPNGTYVVALQANQIKDTSGNAIPAQNLGTFQVLVNATVQTSATPPTQPATFTATPGIGGIALNWTDPANDQTSFLLQRADDSGFTTNVATFPQLGSATTYTDQTAVAGKTYYYQLIAVNPAGNSPAALSGAVRILPPAPTLAGTIFDDGNTPRTPITSVTLVYSQKVTLDSTMVSLSLVGAGGTLTPVTLNVTNPSGDGKAWVISFSGTTVLANGALQDGNYSFTIRNSNVGDAFGQFAGTDQTSTFKVDVAPTVTAFSLVNNAPPHSLAFTFSKDVSQSLTQSTLVLTNTSLNKVIAATGFSWNLATLTATWTFATAIPDGSYVAKLPQLLVTDAGGVHLDGLSNGVAGSSNYLYSFSQTKPSVVLKGNSTVFQGTAYTLTLASETDLAQTIGQYVINWGDSSTSTLTSLGTATHTFASGGTPTISVDVIDSNGTHTNCGSLALAVYRATLSLSGATNANPGAAYTLTASGLNDPGQTVSQYIVHWGDSSTSTFANSGATTATFTHTYTKANFSAGITVDVVDGLGISPNAGSIKVAVNPNPSIQLTGDLNANIGGTYRLAMAAPWDPGFTVTQYTVHWGDGTASTYTTYTAPVTHTYAAVGNQAITVDLTDSTGTYSSAGKMTTLVNPTPTIALAGNPTATLNGIYNLTLGAVADPGQTVTQYVVHWGDSTTSSYSTAGSVTHTYTQTGPANITVDLTDGTGTYANPGSLGLTVNTAQLVALSGNNIYLKADADQTDLDVWIDSLTAGQGTPTQKVPLVSITGAIINGLNAGNTITLDESGGLISLAGGITINGGTGSNSVYIVGSNSNDTVALGSAQSAFNSTSISYQNVSSVTYSDGGGNDTILVTGNLPTTVNSSTGNDTISLAGAGPVAISTGVTTGGAETVAITAGATPAISLNATSGTINILASTGNGIRQVHFAGLNIGAAGRVVMANTSATLGDYSNHANRTLAIVDAGGLNIASGGTLDIGDNSMLLKYLAGNKSATDTMVNNLLTSGFAGQAWNGTGINSSEASNDAFNGSASRAVGWADQFDVGVNSFEGDSADVADGNEIMIKFTYYGDTDLDGKVASSDSAAFSNGVHLPSGSNAYWEFGDMDYSGGKPVASDSQSFSTGMHAYKAFGSL